MNRSALKSHFLVSLSVVAGIAGTGMVYSGATGGSLREISYGVPFLLMGLWWSGRELGRSTLASRAARAARTGSSSKSRMAAGVESSTHEPPGIALRECGAVPHSSQAITMLPRHLRSSDE